MIYKPKTGNGAVVEAIQYKEGFPLSVLQFCDHKASWPRGTDCVSVRTSRGRRKALPGDWVIKSQLGSLRIMSDADFNSEYKEAAQ